MINSPSTARITSSYNPNQSMYGAYSQYNPCQPQCNPCAPPPPCFQPAPCPNPPPTQRYIQKVPYQKKIIQYQEYTYEQQVPKQVKKIQYDQVKKIDYRPVQRKVTDYYAVQVLIINQIQKKYVPKYVPEKKYEMVPIQKISQKINYKPVQRQIVHNKPPDLLARSTSADHFSQGGGNTLNRITSTGTFHQNQENKPMASTNYVTTSRNGQSGYFSPKAPQQFLYKQTDQTGGIQQFGQNSNKYYSNKGSFQRGVRAEDVIDRYRREGYNAEQLLSFQEFSDSLNRFSMRNIDIEIARKVWNTIAKQRYVSIRDLAFSIQRLSNQDQTVTNQLLSIFS